MCVNERNVLAQRIMKGVIALLANAPTFTYHQHFPTYMDHGVRTMQARVALFFLAWVLHSHLHMKSSQRRFSIVMEACAPPAASLALRARRA